MMMRNMITRTRPVSLASIVQRSCTQQAADEQTTPGWRKSKIFPRTKSLATKKNLQVIFLQDTAAGQKGQVLWVKKGFARNYFFPRNEAVFATPMNLDKYRELIDSVDYDEINRIKKLKQYKKRINNLVVNIKRHEKPDGSPHAPVFPETIQAHMWKHHAIELELEQIIMKEPLYVWGEFLISVDLGLGEILKLDVIFSSFRSKSKKKAEKAEKAEKLESLVS